MREIETRMEEAFISLVTRQGKTAAGSTTNGAVFPPVGRTR
jgi:hypothetical protein